MKSTLGRLGRLASRTVSFLLHGRRPRFDHSEAHRDAHPNRDASALDHYRPSAVPGHMSGPLM
ncbi:hypothetical protein FCH28_34790 [Streptomyces piniterrae]|uniref:Uncharacterized protein n=1 Tax=Streptomyces piniterrae TaxID=2571125 RepID=A0A4U0MNG2_9ACTN|nr:hypothetical protein [Streptomyces piniterrae]TJZ42193.1 hypothetical protein FCH28_34790 [Streptomyces piniterrae]